MNPIYPVYIISKGRAKTPLTARQLDKLNVPYKIVIEEQEYDEYAEALGADKILVLPFANLGQGSIPARNFCWEHAKEAGHKRHWILDDNIKRFQKFDGHKRVNVDSGTIFRIAETFVDRYENIGIAGFQYRFFAVENSGMPPFTFNTRIYSCLLIDNSLEHRWRGRYNEDTDLSIRVLKDGLCTVLFYAFLQDKTTTMTMSGGNTEELYSGDGRLQMAQSLHDQHPEICKVGKRFGRDHHIVDYSPFKWNRLIRKQGVKIPNKINEYGMVLKNVEE